MKFFQLSLVCSKVKTTNHAIVSWLTVPPLEQKTFLIH